MINCCEIVTLILSDRTRSMNSADCKQFKYSLVLVIRSICKFKECAKSVCNLDIIIIWSFNHFVYSHKLYMLHK